MINLAIAGLFIVVIMLVFVAMLFSDGNEGKTVQKSVFLAYSSDNDVQKNPMDGRSEIETEDVVHDPKYISLDVNIHHISSHE